MYHSYAYEEVAERTSEKDPKQYAPDRIEALALPHRPEKGQ